MDGVEAQQLRERMEAFIRRRQGLTSDPVVTLADRKLRDLVFEGRQPQFVMNADGTPWTPQNPDGSFPYLPGYDGPMSE